VSDPTTIQTTKTIYPQIYAYVLPGYPPNEGWVKIGYTERKNVDERIRQQTQTAGIQYAKLWSEPARFLHKDAWFQDRELHAWLRRFKGVDQRPKSEWFYYDGTPENAHADFDEFRRGKASQASDELQYQLRAEQEAAVATTLAYAETHPGGEFLWNAKPRFGKTLATYDLVRRMQAEKVLIVTNRPAIANSWFDDFEKYIAWQTNYLFVSTTDSLKERSAITREQFIERNNNPPHGEYYGCIAFISLQDLKGAISFGGYTEKLAWVKGLQWDLLVIDEAHEGVDTLKTDVAFKNIPRNFTLHLSGTPFKAIASGTFSQAQIYNWTYADEQDAKAAWPAESEANNPYEGLPRLNLFSYQMSQMITDEVNKGAQIDGKEMDYAFDLNEFFATTESGKFVHEEEVKKWLDTLTRNQKYPFSTKELRDELKHTFWYLNRVASAKALERLLREHAVFEHYEIVLAAGDGRTDEDEGVQNQRALARVKKAIEEHERTITLSVGQLTTGITIPEWSGVMMLSNLKSPSLYMQAAFRAQNPWTYRVDGIARRKENAYVFDFAPERTLTLYDEFANNLNSKTAAGGGTTNDREENIRKLLNFFPVIAEDDAGRMVELDVRQVLTIPKAIKAQEVVKRGFMSNLLFQNISGVFASAEAREILEQLNPVAPGRVVPSQTVSRIDTQDVEVDDTGEAMVAPEIVLQTTNAHFGEKYYAEVATVVQEVADNPNADSVAKALANGMLTPLKEVARANSVSVSQAEQIARQSGAAIAREIATVRRQANIERGEAQVQYKNEIAAAAHNPAALAEARARYDAVTQAIDDELQVELEELVPVRIKELTEKATEEVLQRGEVKKQNAVEDDVRARLRGFARTIPSFLMAYGEPETTLANFDATIKDEVFKEVTGITLEQFRQLRDTHNFFDPVVFDESVQEFLRKREQLADYFDDGQSEDIFDYIPPQRTNQIYTPKRVVKMMIDKLEEENPDLFTNKDLTFADLYVKSGLFLAEVARRLFVGLESAIPDREARLKHILEHQVYGFAPSEIIYRIARAFVFGGFAGIDDTHLQLRDLTETARSGGKLEMKFDVIVGNPPYQIEDGGGTGTSAIPLYNSYVDKAKELEPRYLSMIIPSRWFTGGKGLDEFRQSMLEDDRIRSIEDYMIASDVFPGVALKGGVCIFLWERDYRGPCRITTHFKEETSTAIRPLLEEGADVFIRFHEGLSVLKKVVAVESGETGSLLLPDRVRFDQLVSIRKPFGLDSKFKGKLSGDADDAQVYVSGGKGYLSRTSIPTGKDLIDKWKVFVGFAAPGTGNKDTYPHRIISTPFIGEPGSISSETYLCIGPFNSRDEAESVLSYLSCRLTRLLILLHKPSHNTTRRVYTFVPTQEWTRTWTDTDLYEKYGISESEIAFIEKVVRPMDLTGAIADEVIDEEND